MDRRLLTLIIHPKVCTGGYVPFSDNSYEFDFDRKRLIKFFKELIAFNKDVKLCYSFTAPPMASKNRFLENEVSIAFACLLSFAEAAVFKTLPIYIFPQDACPNSETIDKERGKALHFTDFKDIFSPKLDQKSTQEVKQKLQGVGIVNNLSYPADVKADKNDEKNLNCTGYLVVRSVSSEDIVDLLAKGSNVVLPSGSNENILLTMVPQYSADWDNFGISWKAENDQTFLCDQLRVPVVVQSNKIFYSNRGVDFMNLFKTELEELSRKLENKSVSSNPFHDDVDEKKPLHEHDDSDDSELRAFICSSFTKVSKEQDKVRKVQKSASASRDGEAIPNSESNTSLNTKQLTDVLNQFKEQMREELGGIVEETVKKYAKKDDTEGMSSSKKNLEARSVINVNDCVKSEADDSDLPKLLNTLSQIEEQLNSIENGASSDVLSAKPNKYAHWHGPHGSHRRGRDFSSLTRRATLGILKKRMKGAVIELEPDLFAICKSGFKVKMARNVTQSFKFALFKYGKYRNSRFEVDFMPTIVPGGGIECCVKPVVKSNDKSQVDDKGQYSFYDVRFRSKERTGKFRCFLKIMRNGKVCAHPLCINVRVKRFCSNSDPIDSAEEAMPGFLSAGSRSRFDENRFGAFESTSTANPDVDEGISGFQEYPSSISSDSDEGEANRENDNDEGIDPGLKMPCAAFEKLKINENLSTRSNFNDDSDSSVSLLLDENEVRDAMDKDLDIVKIPPCFIPHADIGKEPLSVRVKRKFSSARRKKNESSAARVAESSSKMPDWWMAASGEPTGSVSSKKSRSRPFSDFYTFPTFMSASESNALHSQSTTKSFSGSNEELKSASDSSGKPVESPSKCPYKTLYPNLEELNDAARKAGKTSSASKETPSPVAILPEKVFEMTSNVFKSVMNSMKPTSDVKDMIQKNVDETLWSISRSVLGGVPMYGQPPQQPYAAPPPPSPAASVGTPITSVTYGSSLDSLLNPPQYTWSTPSSQTTVPAPVTSIFTSSVASAASATFPDDYGSPSVSQPVQEPMHVTSSTSQFISTTTNNPGVSAVPQMSMKTTMLANPPVENVSPQATGFVIPNVCPSVFLPTNPPRQPPTHSNEPANEVPVTVHSAGISPVQTPQPTRSNVPTTETSATLHSAGNDTSQTPPDTRPGLIAGEEYNHLEPELRKKILQLNEMGFLNDNYNLFLIRKYPTDINKVVESLLNFHDY